MNCLCHAIDTKKLRQAFSVKAANQYNIFKTIFSLQQRQQKFMVANEQMDGKIPLIYSVKTFFLCYSPLEGVWDGP